MINLTRESVLRLPMLKAAALSEHCGRLKDSRNGWKQNASALGWFRLVQRLMTQMMCKARASQCCFLGNKCFIVTGHGSSFHRHIPKVTKAVFLADTQLYQSWNKDEISISQMLTEHDVHIVAWCAILSCTILTPFCSWWDREAAEWYNSPPHDSGQL